MQQTPLNMFPWAKVSSKDCHLFWDTARLEPFSEMFKGRGLQEVSSTILAAIPTIS